MFRVLEVRERLVAKLALLSGMRPGELFGLKWSRLVADYADIRQRIIGGCGLTQIGPVGAICGPVRRLLMSIDQWRAISLDSSADAWVFPPKGLRRLGKR